jgi:hypothetical protein
VLWPPEAGASLLGCIEAANERTSLSVKKMSLKFEYRIHEVGDVMCHIVMKGPCALKSLRPFCNLSENKRVKIQTDLHFEATKCNLVTVSRGVFRPETNYKWNAFQGVRNMGTAAV